MDNPERVAPAIQREDFLRSVSRWLGQETAHTGLLLIDLGNLAFINEHYSYEAGDRVLQAWQERLLAIRKLPDTLYRIGSHQFAFILPAMSSPALLMMAINKVTRVLQEEVCLQSKRLEPEVFVGVAYGMSSALDAYGLLKRAEASLGSAKAGKPQDFSANTAVGIVQQQHHLERDFKAALLANEFELYYQPKLNLKTGSIDQVEALLRWQRREHGFVRPDQVVDLATQLGESYNLTKWVVHTAVRQAKTWQPRLNLAVAVNVQADLLGSPEICHLVQDALAIWGLPSDRLVVEITETAVIEDKNSGLDTLLRLKNSGISLSIDDFGTGYSSLSYFKEIPANELKIDMSFVRDMLKNPQDQHIVKIIIEIAHLFELRVVAEGVEDQATLAHLKNLGCDYVQGYFIARPQPADEFEQWLEGYQLSCQH